jgi:hypothetical protein
MRFQWRRAAAAGVVMDETGTIVDPAPHDRRDVHETATSAFSG